MRLAFPDLVTEVEGGSAVRCPGQFPDIVTSLHLLYPKSASGLSAASAHSESVKKPARNLPPRIGSRSDVDVQGRLV